MHTSFPVVGICYPHVNPRQFEFSQQDSGIIVPVFQKGDDPIDAINHMMSFLTAIVTSRYPTTNNQLTNSSNPRQQATSCYNGQSRILVFNTFGGVDITSLAAGLPYKDFILPEELWDQQFPGNHKDGYLLQLQRGRPYVQTVY
ncbi:hypothetical protein Tco_0038537 [Tanacetum coccineum]